MRNHETSTNNRLVYLGRVTERTTGQFWGDYYDGLLLPLLSYKLLPG